MVSMDSLVRPCLTMVIVILGSFGSEGTSSSGRLYARSFGLSEKEVCALDNPSMILAAPSVGFCAIQCNRLSGCNWFNYLPNNGVNLTCQLFNFAPVIIDFVDGCTLHAESTLEAHLSLNFTNDALGRQTWAVNYYPGGTPDKAVDGSLLRNGNAGECFVTNNPAVYNPWWAVDVGNMVRVYGVNVTSRDDGANMYQSLELEIGLTNTSPAVTAPPTAGYTICGKLPSSLSSYNTIFVQCPQLQPRFRYVVIVRNLPAATWLAVCEAEVYVADVIWQ